MAYLNHNALATNASTCYGTVPDPHWAIDITVFTDAPDEETATAHAEALAEKIGGVIQNNARIVGDDPRFDRGRFLGACGVDA